MCNKKLFQTSSNKRQMLYLVMVQFQWALPWYSLQFDGCCTRPPSPVWAEAEDTQDQQTDCSGSASAGDFKCSHELSIEQR